MSASLVRVSISGRGAAAAFPRIVRVLFWQQVVPRRLVLEETPEGGFSVMVEIVSDPWRIDRLREHWWKVIGVCAVVIETDARSESGSQGRWPSGRALRR